MTTPGPTSAGARAYELFHANESNPLEKFLMEWKEGKTPGLSVDYVIGVIRIYTLLQHNYDVKLSDNSEMKKRTKANLSQQPEGSAMPSSFNPDTFLDTIVETPFETHRTTLPPKDNYLGAVDGLATRIVESKGQGAKVILDVDWEILDDEAKLQLNLDKIVVRQSVFLDFDETGKLARGINKNIQLGQIRDAVGQNTSGAWAPRMLKGAGPAQLKISERSDEKNPSVKYNDVDRVTRM
jgi:hypothetical protein